MKLTRDLLYVLVIEFIQLTTTYAYIRTNERLLRMPVKSHDPSSLVIENDEVWAFENSLRRKRRIQRSVPNGERFNLHGTPGSGYYLELAIGTPPQLLNVLVDTGSSNFAVAESPLPEINNTYYHARESSTFVNVSTDIYVPYTLGEWEGYLLNDVVSVPSAPASGSFTANIAGITRAEDFFINHSQWQGILGLGYPDLARPDSSVTPFLDSWFATTSQPHVFSLQLCGVYDPAASFTIETETDNNDSTVSLLKTGGVMILGEVDSSLYTGTIQYTPVYKQWYYEVVLTDMKVNGRTLDVPCKEYNFDKTIVDSGTTDLRLPEKVYQKFLREMQHSTVLYEDGWFTEASPAFWSGTEMMCWERRALQWEGFPNVTLTLEARPGYVFDLEITAHQYLMLVETGVDEVTGVETYCYKFAVASSDTGTVIGAVVMEGFYVIFDREVNKVGFAQTSCPTLDPNAPKARVSATYKVKYNTTECAYIKVESDEKTLAVAMYFLLGVILLCMTPLVILFLHWQCFKRCGSSSSHRCFRNYGQTDQDNLLEPPTPPMVASIMPNGNGRLTPGSLVPTVSMNYQSIGNGN